MDSNRSSILPPELPDIHPCDRQFVDAFLASPAATLREIGLLTNPGLIREIEAAMPVAAVDGVHSAMGLLELAVMVRGNPDPR